MAKSLKMDFSKLREELNVAADIMGDAIQRGVEDVLDEWRADAVDVAPIAPSGGTLRRSISVGKVKRDGINVRGDITANAIEVAPRGKWAGRRFNYAYYIHEKDAGGKKLRTPGTEKKFLDVALDRKEKRWIDDIETEVRDALKGRGW